MSARKDRPAFGTPVVAGMSMRDIGSALGISTGEMCRWMALAKIPKAEFERRLSERDKPSVSAAAILAMETPVPARGRVERAAAIIRHMTPIERSALLDLLLAWAREGGAA